MVPRRADLREERRLEVTEDDATVVLDQTEAEGSSVGLVEHAFGNELLNADVVRLFE